MAARQSYSNVEVKAGLFMAFGLALFLGMLLLYGKIPNLWRNRVNLHAAFSTIQTLRPDGPVLYNGVEVGRVKSMSVLHLTSANLAKFKTLTKRDLDFLPLLESQRKELRLVPDRDFAAKCKELLEDKTMIELVLEVRAGSARRYLVDDMVRIHATTMGDASVEIVSGCDRPLDLDAEVIVVGYSDDFFSSLARSMGQVRDVLSTVTDVVSGDERLAFRRATGRLDGILDSVSDLAGLARQRAPVTTKKVAGLDESSTQSMESLGKLFQRLQPDTSRFLSRLDEAREDVGKRFEAALREVERAESEWKAQGREIGKDIEFASAQSQPHLKEIQTNLNAFAACADGISDRLDLMTGTADRLLAQSTAEMERFKECTQQGFRNLKSPELLYVREHIDKLIGQKERGEGEFYAALQASRALERVARGPQEAWAQLLDLRSLLASFPARGGPGRAEVDRALLGLKRLKDAYEQARDAAAASLLKTFSGSLEGADPPPFPRKRSGDVPWPKR